MANELLDFVMGLVRDPAAAASYAADPARAIADAHLSGVTSVDVDNLIPMVSDSVSMSTPGFGPTTPSLDGPAGAVLDNVNLDNVWSSGAAHAAFEAFDAGAPNLPGGLDLPVVHDPAAAVIQAGSTIGELAAVPDLVAPAAEVFAPLDPVLPDLPVEQHLDPTFPVSDWIHRAEDVQHVDPQHPGFDFLV